ncbi:MAG: helix-turn-helix domain-containing protein [Synergistaceae bacterium]|nr:helix-turn-helix domain-containing protein [Synergistaceae bacterium]
MADRKTLNPDVFASRLRELRLAKRLILRNVGDAVGCHMKTIGNLENANKTPSLGVILALADFFGVSVDYLVGWTDCKADANDSGDETDSPSSSTGTERKKLVELFEDLRGEDIDKVLDYIDFLRYGQQRGNRKEQKR